MQEINFYSLSRSGHHAIIFWFLHSLGGVTEKHNKLFFSNKDIGIYFYNNVNVNSTVWSCENYLKKFAPPLEYSLIVRSYEDILCDGCTGSFTVVRDFLNLLCSRYMKWKDDLCWSKKYCISSIVELVACWKQHLLQPNSQVINYNHWCVSREYRDSIASLLAFDNSADLIEYVPPFGGGSSFIGMSKETDLARYNLRFKQVILPSYLVETILEDGELLALNNNLFDIDIAKELKQ